MRVYCSFRSGKDVALCSFDNEQIVPCPERVCNCPIFVIDEKVQTYRKELPY